MKDKTAREAAPYHWPIRPQISEPNKIHPQHLTIAASLFVIGT